MYMYMRSRKNYIPGLCNFVKIECLDKIFECQVNVIDTLSYKPFTDCRKNDFFFVCI